MQSINLEEIIMGKLVVDGNKVYTVDEACMRRKNLTLAQVRDAESSRKENSGETVGKKNKGELQ